MATIHDFKDRRVGFIVRTRKDKFLPVIADCLDVGEDGDYLLATKLTAQHCGDLAEAQEEISELPPGAVWKKFYAPIKSGEPAWVSELLRENTDA